MPTATNPNRARHGSHSSRADRLQPSHGAGGIARAHFVSRRSRRLHAADELRRRGILEEAVVVSTCNRSELYGVPGELAPSAAEAMEEFFTSFHGIPRDRIERPFLSLGRAGRGAPSFPRCGGLDSMMLGEAEILGQLRTAYNQALDHGATGRC